MKQILLFLPFLLIVSCSNRSSNQLFPQFATLATNIYSVKSEPEGKPFALTLLKGESFRIVEVTPSQLLVSQKNRKGWIRIKDPSSIRREGKKVRILESKGLPLFESLTNRNPFAIARMDASYSLKGIFPKLVKIRLDNGRLIWIDVGSPLASRIKEFSLSSSKPHENTTARIDQGNQRLVFWNRCGSEDEVRKSEVGPDGKIVGTLEFKEGKFGKGLNYTDAESYALFDDIPVGDEGCYEVWISTGFDVVAGQPYPSGNWGFAGCVEELRQKSFINLGLDDGWGIQGWVWSDPQTPFLLRQRDNQTAWKAGTWHHIALVWSKSKSIPGGKSLALYVDGKMTTSEMEDFKGFGGLMRLSVPNWAYEYMDACLDEIRIWNFAKTDFSDREKW